MLRSDIKRINAEVFSLLFEGLDVKLDKSFIIELGNTHSITSQH